MPADGPYTQPDDLIGRNICTSFVGLTRKFFAELEERDRTGESGVGNGGKQLRTQIKYLSGSVEAACTLGVADGIVDLVGGCRIR